MLDFIKEKYKNFLQKKKVLGLKGTLNFYFQKVLLKKKLITVYVPEIGKTFFLRPFDSDLGVLLQVFEQRGCDVNLNYPVNFIIDGGAYVGYTTAFLAKRYPNAKIIAIEPELDNFDLLSKNCREFDQVFPIRRAIWCSDDYLSIDKGKQLSWNIKVSPKGNSSRMVVQGITIPDLLRHFETDEIDLLKLDIEGSEETLFSACSGDWIDKVRTMIIELHGQGCEEALLRALSSHLFSVERRGEKWILTRMTN